MGHGFFLNGNAGQVLVIGDVLGFGIYQQVPLTLGGGNHFGGKIGVDHLVIAAGGVGQQGQGECLGIGQELDAVAVHAGDQAVTGGDDGFRLIHFKQIHHQLLVGLPLGHQLAVGGGVAHVGEGHQGVPCLDGPALADLDGGDDACVGSGVPGAVDVQLAGTKALDLYFIAHGVIIIFDDDRDVACKAQGHLAPGLRAVGKFDGDSSTNGHGFLNRQVHSHQAVQTQHRQSAVIQHHILNGLALFGIENFDSAASQGGDGGIGVLFGFFFNFLRQNVQGILDFCDGGHDSNPVHGGDCLTLGNSLAVFHQESGKLDSGRDLHVNGVFFRQLAAADELGVDGSHLNGAGEDAGLGAVLFGFAFGNKGHGRQHSHHRHRTDGGDDAFQFGFLCFIHSYPP